jgi:hypothetical protein
MIREAGNSQLKTSFSQETPKDDEGRWGKNIKERAAKNDQWPGGSLGYNFRKHTNQRISQEVNEERAV